MTQPGSCLLGLSEPRPPWLSVGPQVWSPALEHLWNSECGLPSLFHRSQLHSGPVGHSQVSRTGSCSRLTREHSFLMSICLPRPDLSHLCIFDICDFLLRRTVCLPRGCIKLNWLSDIKEQQQERRRTVFISPVLCAHVQLCSQPAN